MRILVTGSRSWTDRYTIMTAIERPTIDAFSRGDTVLVIHGDAGGADRIARNVVRGWHADGWPIDEHAMPAKWAECAPDCPPHRRTRAVGVATYCPTAGHRRNAEMVNLGPDLCLAFVRDNSRGATNCIGLAQAAGIPTVRIDWDDRDGPKTLPGVTDQPNQT